MYFVLNSLNYIGSFNIPFGGLFQQTVFLSNYIWFKIIMQDHDTDSLMGHNDEYIVKSAVPSNKSSPDTCRFYKVNKWNVSS